MLDFEKFRPLFGTWAEKIEPFFKSNEMSKIFVQLKELSRKGVSIYPDHSQVFRAFKECDINQLKVVWLGLSPYPTKVGNTIVADGLAFSCGNTEVLQPSLDLIWQAVEDDLHKGLNLHMEKHTDLTYMAKEGVLLLNAALTVESGKPESHLELWKPFMEFLFKKVFSVQSGLIFTFFGKEASIYNTLTMPFMHYSKILEHPAFAARQMRRMIHQNVFSWTNEILRSNNGKDFEINWLNTEKVPW